DAIGLENLFGSLHGNVGHAEAQGGQRVIGVVVDEGGIALTINAAGDHNVAFLFHGDLGPPSGGRAEGFYVAERAQGPSGVVVRARITWIVVLRVEYGVSQAAVRLVHAHHVAAGRDNDFLFLSLSRLLLVFLLVFLVRGGLGGVAPSG